MATKSDEKTADEPKARKQDDEHQPEPRLDAPGGVTWVEFLNNREARLQAEE
jgi:hypothetical protein